MDFLSSAMDMLFGGGRAQAGEDISDQEKQALSMFQQLMQQGQSRLNPFIQNGQNQIPGINNFIHGLNTQASNFNPQQSVNDIVKGYKETPYATFEKNQALDAMNNQAAISGQLGGGQNKIDNAQLADTISNKYLQNYIGNVQNQQGYGLRMNDQVLNNLMKLLMSGRDSANDLNNFTANMGKNEADAYSGIAQGNAMEDAGESSGLTNLFGVLGKGGLFKKIPLLGNLF